MDDFLANLPPSPDPEFVAKVTAALDEKRKRDKKAEEQRSNDFRVAHAGITLASAVLGAPSWMRLRCNCPLGHDGYLLHPNERAEMAEVIFGGIVYIPACGT